MNGTPAPGPALSEVHRAYLNDHAVSDEVIEAQGIRSEGDVIVFTWREGDHVTEQRRPWPGPAGQYYWAAGEDLHLNVIRDPGPDAPVLLCEGTKQSLAVASWAPAEYAVMGMPGCYGWTMSRKLDLARFAGRQVLIMLDADASDNLDVYEAGSRLASELAMEDPPAGALFIPSPSWGKNGIDDYLSRIAPGRRGDRLAKLLASAQAKPADRKPTKRKAQAPDTGGRPMILVDGDRREVIRQVLWAMRQLWDGTDLFCYGGVLTRLREAATEPLGKGAFLRWLSEAVSCFRGGGMAGYQPGWPDPQTVEALMASADEFMPLDRISTVPFIRADGTVCAKNGYDLPSRTVLITGNSGMDRLDIPDAPSADDAAGAAAFLLDQWLSDMPFRNQSSRAGALALTLTPFIRGLVPLVPIAVISGLQPGVGKGLLNDCISILVTGNPSPPMAWVADDDNEIRKQILSAFRAGTGLVTFDEAHVISGAAITRALTSITYTDRILGVSEMASYPNNVTWIALGNQVQVLGDMARRAHWIELYPSEPNPQDRPESAFSNPDLRSWTRENRPELVTAALTVIRAWFAAGCPPHSRGTRMGSFEKWDEVMSGILAHAGVEGFLEGLAGRRGDADFSGAWWGDHIGWLHRVFGTEPFTAGDVKARAMAASGAWEAPPGMDDVMRTGYIRELGKAYSKVQDRWFGNLQLARIGRGHDNTTKWAVQVHGGSHEDVILPDLDGGSQGGINQDHASGGDGGVGGIPIPTRMRGRAHDTRARTYARTHVREQDSPALPPFPPLALSADIETGPADELFTYTQRDETGYVRLAGLISETDTPVITDGPRALAILEQATEITGHNFMGFDGLAFAWHLGADWEALAAKVRDTELIARQWHPPRSRESGSSTDKYDLDHVAVMLGLPGKTDELKRIARQHGGYDRIPLDDPAYRSYLEGDLHATQAVAQRLHHDDYTRREHRLATLNGRMSLNGFAVDRELLDERLAQGAERKGQALALLHDGWGLPLTRTVTRGRGSAKHDVEEPVISPLATDAGRAWLAGQYERYQVPDPPRTGKARKLALGSDDLARVSSDPACPAELRAMIALMDIVTGTRTVYQNAAAHLAADGRVHPRISMRQASGRSSTTDPGLTVFGKHGGRHVERDIFTADEGHVLFSADLSQVDMRGIAALCQDPAYMALFADPDRDAHAEIAAQVFGDPHGGHCPKDCELRQAAKARGHGWNYGMGPDRMIRDGVDPEMAYGFDNGMRERFPVLCAWREEVRSVAAAGEILDNGFGRRMRAEPSRAYTVAPALMGQGSAGDIMKEVLDRLDRRAPELRPYYRVMVHDEQVFSCPEGDYEEIMNLVKDTFTWEWRGVPILCDISGPGRSWGEISAK